MASAPRQRKGAVRPTSEPASSSAPAAPAGSATAPPAGSAPAPPPLRLRRSVDDLGPGEVAELRAGFERLMARDDENGYDAIAGIYGAPRRLVPHGTPLFLAWNRAHLLRFERALQAVAPGIALPYWDWTAGNAIPAAFASERAGAGPNVLHRHAIPESARTAGDVPPETTRKPVPTPAPGPSLDELLAPSSYEEFARLLEDAHNVVHIRVGGTMGSIETAAYDPLFWVLHAGVDRIWALWQRLHPDEHPPLEVLDTGLVELGIAGGDVLDVRAAGYDYAPPRERGPDLTGASSDLPSDRATLGFGDYATAFAQIITSKETRPPLTIGIFAPWGMGKSSLLRQIKSAVAELDPSPDPKRPLVPTVDFNAWEYSASEAVWPGLVRKTMRVMEANAEWRWGDRLVQLVRRNGRTLWTTGRGSLLAALVVGLVLGVVALALTVSGGAAVAAGALAALGLGGTVASAARAPLSRWVTALVRDSSYGDEIGWMADIRADLEFLDERLRRQDRDRRVLVIIDDLDRCEPAKIVEVLQAINLLLQFPSFVVLLGIDARIVTHAIEAHYRGLLEVSGASGYEYLEKIVQIPFHIPEPSRAELEEFLADALPGEAAARDDAGAADRSGTVLAGGAYGTRSQDGGGGGRGGARGEGGGSGADDGYGTDDGGTDRGGGRGGGSAPAEPPPPRVPESAFSEAEVQAFQAAAPFLRRNPRHIKRLANVYRLVRTLAWLRGDRGAETILRRRELAIRWIVACGQWPYACNAMLARYRDMADRDETLAGADVLEDLYDRIAPTLVPEAAERLDDDPAVLRALLRDGGTAATWEELGCIAAYTVNFNAAIDEELRRLEAAAEQEGGGPPTPPPPLGAPGPSPPRAPA